MVGWVMMMTWCGYTSHISGPLWGESTGHQCIPLLKGQYCRALTFTLLLAWTRCQKKQVCSDCNTPWCVGGGVGVGLRGVWWALSSTTAGCLFIVLRWTACFERPLNQMVFDLNVFHHMFQDGFIWLPQSCRRNGHPVEFLLPWRELIHRGRNDSSSSSETQGSETEMFTVRRISPSHAETRIL